MKKRIILITAAFVAVSLGVVGMSAFEAHVINVTAKIENALAVTPDKIAFGTVFPQEMLVEDLSISMSQSFLDEKRVDDINYVIKQKPKVRVVDDSTGLHDPYAVISPSTYPDGIIAHEYCLNESPADPGDISDEYYTYCYPNLCGQLSKHKNIEEGLETDTEVDAPHDPALGTATGRLAKSEQDTEDNWQIDLVVPCFEGMCDQAYDTAVYGQPLDARLEHEVFGCDLWIEVTEISETGETNDLGICGDGNLDVGEQCDDGNTESGDGCSSTCTAEQLGCSEKADVMLVLDRSGSIDSLDLIDLQNAAIAFVDALSPSTDGVHMGQVSFSTSATLDEHLTEVGQDVKDAIDALDSDGLTNLDAAILLATQELANPGDGHDRADLESPDYLVVITDGAPTACAGDCAGDYAGAAADAADAARAAGAKVYVVGVGTNTDTSNYLSTEIANHTGQYYDAADYSALSAVLSGIANCEN